jgi:hypothetical protein
MTQRLHLRRARQGDAPVLFKNYTGAQNCSRSLQRHPHQDVAQTEAMLRKWCLTAWDEAGAPFSWVISTLDDDEPIGLFVVVDQHDFVNTNVYKLVTSRYRVARQFCASGFPLKAIGEEQATEPRLRRIA